METENKAACEFRLRGITDEVTTCDCCGKTNLKKTVCLESDATGLVYYGCDCAGRALYGTKTRSNGKTAERYAAGIEYAKKWIGIHGGSTKVYRAIAQALRVRGVVAHEYADHLVVAGTELR